MGNRAIITTKENYENNGAGIYLHWNGGRDSVEGFLLYAKLQGCRGGDYALARLTQYIGNWFGGTLSLGLVPARCGAGDDNGVYIINDALEIIDRKEIGEGFNEQMEYDIAEFVESINEAQPEGIRLDNDLLKEMVTSFKYPISYEGKIEMLNVGDKVWVQNDLTSEYELEEVVGIGENGAVVNGSDVSGIPYIGKFGETPKTNPNNYLTKRRTFYVV